MELQWMLLLLLLLLLLLHVEANNLTEVEVELGQNVTITCSDNITDLYWFMQIHGNLRVFIGRTYSKRQEQSLYSPSDRSKFLLQENRLSITNVTADDCRLYYCAKKNNTSIHYLDTFLLVSDVPPPSPPCPSSSPGSVSQEKSIGSLLFSVPVVYGSLTFNGLFILVTIGLASMFLCCKKKSSRDFLVDEPPPVTYEMPQYEEIRFTSSIGPAAAAPPPECIYYKAQLPCSTLPPPH